MAVSVFVFQGIVYDPPLDHFPKWDPALATEEEEEFGRRLYCSLMESPFWKKLRSLE